MHSRLPDYWRIAALDSYSNADGGQWTLSASGEYYGGWMDMPLTVDLPGDLGGNDLVTPLGAARDDERRNGDGVRGRVRGVGERQVDQARHGGRVPRVGRVGADALVELPPGGAGSDAGVGEVAQVRHPRGGGREEATRPAGARIDGSAVFFS